LALQFGIFDHVAGNGTPLPTCSRRDSSSSNNTTARAFVSTTSPVRCYVADSVATGITYFVCDFGFGSLPYAAPSRSLELFANEVTPAFR